MATFRCNPIIVFVLMSLACAPRDNTPASSAGVASIQKTQIEHLTPRPDFVGPLPATLEWTAAEGVDSYTVIVETEIEIPVFDQDGIKTTSVPWPKEIRLEPGTYYWRIAGMKGNAVVADSGRAAFVVMEK